MRQGHLYPLFSELVLLLERDLSVTKTLCFLVNELVIIVENYLLSVFRSRLGSPSSSFLRRFV